MVKFRMIGNEGSIVEYEYAIEGKGTDIGVVSIDTSSGRGQMVDHEDSTWHKLYACKVISYLEKVASSGPLPESGTIAWY